MLVDDLWNGERSVCLFVHKGRCYWVADNKSSFLLDGEREYKGYLEKGYISRAQYNSACSEFRGGALKLTADNFMRYLLVGEPEVLSRREFEDVLLFGLDSIDVLYRKVENYYLSGVELEAFDARIASSLVSRLPMFYVNFDRRIYIHMDYGRMHEDSAYSGWSSGSSDFCYLIPSSERYWFLNGMDFWKFRFL